MKHVNILLSFCFICICCIAQQTETFRKQYDAFKKQKQTEYADFRQKANRDYAEFMRKAWVWHQAKSCLPMPTRPDPPVPAPVPPTLDKGQPLKEKITPYKTIIDATPVIEQPIPVAPIPEIEQTEGSFRFYSYGTAMQVRLNEDDRFSLQSTAEADVAEAWENLSGSAYNNLIRDCLTIRAHYQLCDWAYLCTLEQLANSFLGKDTPEAVLLQAFLFNQSGYQVRLGRSKSNRLYMLIASRHIIYDMNFFDIDGQQFYPIHYNEDGLFIFNHTFPKEQQLSLEVNREQLFAENLSPARTLQSKGEYALSVTLAFNKNLLDFYNTYPQSYVNNDGTTKWRFYAQTPICHTIKEKLYSVLKTAINGKSEQEAANILINFVQTAFTYGYDDEIWGGDRPFFADETLYYPYSDCEDRAILFSKLIRDLLHLDTVLLYYPGHLAMAICFHENAGGHTLVINNKKFTYCEPTCSGYAPIGWCPEDLAPIHTEVIRF